MIEQDINERMAGLAPSQNIGIDSAVASIMRDRGMTPTVEQPIEEPVVQEVVAPVADPFDDVADVILRDRRERLTSSMYGASKVNPDKAALAQKLARETGIGSGIALRHLDEMAVDSRMREIERKNYFASNPVLADQLSDPEFAAVAQDDIGNLEKIGDFFLEAYQFSRYGYTPSTLKGYARGVAMVERGKIGTAAEFGLTTPQDIERAEQLREDMTKLQGGGLFAATAEVVAQQIESLKVVGTAAAAGAAAGSVIPGVGTAAGGALGFAGGTVMSTAAMEGGNAYLDMRRDGVSDDVAIPASIAIGYLNGVIEVVGMKVATAPFKGLAKKVFAEATAEALQKPTVRAALAIAGKEYAKQVGSEATEEALQQLVSVIGERIAKAAEGIEYEGTLKSDAGQIIDSFAGGALASVLLGGIGPGANLIVDINRAEAASSTQRILENLSAAAREGTLRQRSPVMFERYLQAQAERYDADTIYISAPILRDVINQSGLTPEQLEQAMPGMAERIREGLVTGGDVLIPTAQFATNVAGSKFGDALIPHMRLDPDAKSASEASAILKNRDSMRQEAVQIIDEMERTNDAFVQSARKVEDTFRQQVESAGRPREEADAISLMLRDFYVTMAAKMGITPEEAYAADAVTIAGMEGVGRVEPMEQAGRLSYPSLARAWNRYNSGEQVMTVGDLADKIERLDDAGKLIPQEVLDAVRVFRDAQREEREMYGERGGTEEDAGNALEIAVQNAAEQLREEPPVPNIMEQAARIDADYLAAVERGDMETAQRMVDEVANQSMPDSQVRQDNQLQVRYHGGKAGITVFGDVLERPSSAYGGAKKNLHNQGIWLAANPGVLGEEGQSMYEAAAYAANYLPDAEIYPVYVNITNPKRIGLFDASGVTVEELQQHGYDGAYIVDTGAWVAFSPNQIKRSNPVTYDESGAVVPLSRRFDITSPRIFEQAAGPQVFEQRPVTPGFYSALERELTAIDAKAMAASGWKERIKGLVGKGAIKADELEWTGLLDWIDMQEGKVSKDTVLEFVQSNGVRVERFGMGTAQAATEAASVARDAFFGAFKERYGSVIINGNQLFDDDVGFGLMAGNIAVAELPQDLQPLAQRWLNASMRYEEERETEKTYQTKYEQYTLPGGMNYREVLLTLPRIPTDDFGRYLAKMKDKYGEDYAANMTEQESARLNELRQVPAGFRSTHWNQPNVLVHLRMNDRVDADGKRVLFVEEVQSDWGQAGVKRGFVNQRAADEAELADLLQKQEEDPSEAVKTKIARIQKRLTQAQYDIAKAPYVETTDGWLNLGLKQIMLEAVNGGYDRVAFVNGQQSADRYDLSKQVSRVRYQDMYGGAQTNGRIIAYDKQGQPVLNRTIETPAELENYVGKEVAERLLDAPPHPGNYGGLEARQRELSGLDLKVGGKGMMEFYDSIVPIAMNKLLKKYGGGKIGQVGITEQGTMRNLSVHSDGTQYWLEFNDGTRASANVASYLEANAIREQLESGISKQPGFAVIPEIVKKMESGLPLFQAARGPARGFIDPQTLIATINQGGDLSTLIHESAHAFLLIYSRIAERPDAPAQIKADIDALLKWFGVAGGTPEARLAAWNSMTLEAQKQYHEQFAYSFEIYAWEGKAPSAELRGLFNRFRTYLTRIYKSIRDELNAIYRREFGKDLPILTNEVRQVMDRMLASEEQIRRYQASLAMAPYFQTQEQAGMDDATWAAYVAMNQEAEDQAISDLTKASLAQVGWMKRARATAERAEDRGMAARRKEVRAEADAEVRLQLVYRAQQYLRTGRFRDEAGEEVEVAGPHRLSIERIEAVYAGIPTEESVAAIRATGMAMPSVVQPNWRKLGTGKSGMLAKEGLDPEMVAQTFGYDGADAMIRALVDAKPLAEAVEARTDELMQERYGEMDTPDAREQRISMAIHNEARARFIAVELRHIARATEPVRVMLEAARMAAEDIISGKRLRDIRPRDHEAAEARAARDADGARRAGGNPAAAAQAAYTRAKNAVLDAPREDTPAALLAATEAAEVAGEAARAASMAASAERIDRFVREYGNVAPDLMVIRAKRAQLYQNQLAAEARKAKEYVEKQVKYLRRVLRESNRKRMGAGYADQIEALLANVSLVAMTAEQRQRMADLADWLKKMEENGTKPDISEDLAKAAFRVPYKDLTLDQFRELVEAVRTIEYMGKNEQKLLLEKQKAEFRELETGIVKRIEAVARSKGRDEKIRRSAQTKAGKAMTKLRGFFSSGLKAWAIVEILDGGPDGPLYNFLIRTATDRANMETDMTAQATARLAEILAPWYEAGNMMAGKLMFPSIGRSLTREARLAIALNYGNAGNIQRLLDGEGWTEDKVQPILESLTAAEWDAVQQVWDFMDSYRPLIAEKERRLYGKEPSWVEPQELVVRTADGQVKTLRGGYYPIVYDPVATFRAEKQSEVDTAEAQLKGAYSSATTRRTFTKERAAKVVDRPLLYSLQGLWSGVTDVIHDLSWHEWLIDANRLMRSEDFDRIVRARYGENPKLELRRWIEDVAAGNRGVLTPGAQASAFFRQNVSVAGLGYSIRGALMQLTGFSLSVTRVGYGPLVRAIGSLAMNPLDTMKRVNSMSKFMEMRSRTQFRELNEIRNRVEGERGWQRGIRSHAYTMMLSMQRMVDVPTWIAGYENAIAIGKDEASAIALADQAVIATQGSGLLKDLSRIEREPGLAKLFTVFYSYFNTVFNLAAVQSMTARSKGKAAHDLLLILVVPVMLEQLLKELLTPDGDDAEEKDLPKIAAKLTRAEVEYLLGMFVYVREMQGFAGLIEGQMRGYEGPAGMRMITTVQKAAQQAAQGEFDRAFRRSAVDLLGAGIGLPSAQINRTIDGLEALSEGETQNPLSALMGIQRR